MDRGATRRGALGVLAGIAGIGLSGVATSAKRKPKAEKVDVCHYDADGDTWVAIRVSPRGWDHGHSKHEQDFLRGADEDGGCCTDTDCAYLNNEFDCLVGVCDPGTGSCQQVGTGQPCL